MAFVLWFTGVPASGKSTIGRKVEQLLKERGIPIENLDADEIRANLSPNLGYTENDRDINTKRLAFLASLLEKHNVSAIVAAVSSLRRFRDRARSMSRNFVEIYVDCPTEECMKRDPKGLYAKAKRGEVNDIAGLHQPYEAPLNPEVVCKSGKYSIEDCANQVILKLEEMGLLPPETYTFEDEEIIKKRLKALGYL
ncbi:MAG: adenylyl-sulfate kinase [Theionarchaea archaeon]|nr:adenylyl-sulfate kinase [Theionarchaea archaeon]MBU7000675.1 adenylyl-sulfate kinase [Theionarchaea archaeon]MBU7021037.1 adenylyl-sulfate kinase [Theionarchaea archaeon]